MSSAIKDKKEFGIEITMRLNHYNTNGKPHTIFKGHSFIEGSLY